MATYLRYIYDMTANATYNKQVITAGRISASYILLTEAPTWPNHTLRLVWAKKILGYNGVQNVDVIQSLLAIDSSNAALQAVAPAGPWLSMAIYRRSCKLLC